MDLDIPRRVIKVFNRYDKISGPLFTITQAQKGAEHNKGVNHRIGALNIFKKY